MPERHGVALYLGCAVGAPPGVPGGGITGVVRGVGSGTVPWMPGSTPMGGRITPRARPPPSRSSTAFSPVGPSPRRSRRGAAASPPGREPSTSEGVRRRASGAGEVPDWAAAGPTVPSTAASASTAGLKGCTTLDPMHPDRCADRRSGNALRPGATRRTGHRPQALALHPWPRRQARGCRLAACCGP